LDICCEGHLASGCAVMSKYFFRNHHWEPL